MKTMTRLILIACLVLPFAACKKAEAPQAAVKAPMSAPTTDDRQAWVDYLNDVVPRNMAGIAKMARSKQPGLIIVDRTVAGEFENYTTPEQQVPDKPLDHPWESCITMGNSWSYVPGDHYKSAKDIITLLVKIVSRGGNLLLNIGPGPDGDWDPVAYQRLEEIGKWMKVNSEGIYGSKAVAPYSEGNIYYTQSTNATTIYAYVLEDSISSRSLSLHVNDPKKIKKITLLHNEKKVKWRAADDVVNISLPAHFTWGNVLKIEY